MSNVDNEGFRTLDQARASRTTPQYGTAQRLNPGELEEIEAAARRGAMTAPNEALALVNTITDLTRRIARRFNETAEARQEAARARERAESVERTLKAQGPMADLGHLADAVAGRERAERQAREAAEEVAALDRELKHYRSGHVCVDGCRPNAHVAFQGRRQLEELKRELAEAHARIQEYYQDAIKRTRVIDQIRQRFGIGAGADLYDTLCRKVGDLQTSEADLVSAPLKARIAELEQTATQALAREQAAEHRAARHARRLDEAEQRHIGTRDEAARLHRQVAELGQSVRANGMAMSQAQSRIDDLEQSVQARDRLLAKATQDLRTRETEIQLLEVALADWDSAGEKIAELAGSEDTEEALAGYNDPGDGGDPHWHHLIRVVRGIRNAIPRLVEEAKEGPVDA